MIKKITTILIILILIVAIGNIAYGFGLGEISPVSPTNKDSVLDPAKALIGFIKTVGVIVSVVIIIIIGIKYMLGSAEEKAEYKKSLMPYVIGSAVLFGASAFSQIIYDFVKSL